ncbi:MAG: hypothetical protein WCB68_21530, partial [Pyrinomonadaceae bacterium]
PGTCYGRKGSGYIKRKIQGFNLTAQSTYYLALIDFMDTHLLCPAEVIAQWIPNRQPKMLFRIVVREIESWLMADRHNLAGFLKISIDKVPRNPEQLHDPKLKLINLARGTRDAHVRSALVPEIGSTAQVGKLYDSEMRRFINRLWNVEAARNNAPSLDKCLKRLEEL